MIEPAYNPTPAGQNHWFSEYKRRRALVTAGIVLTAGILLVKDFQAQMWMLVCFGPDGDNCEYVTPAEALELAGFYDRLRAN